MKKYIIYFLFLLPCINLSAQHRYTIEQCKQMALENNRKIKNSILEIETAEEGKKEAFTNYFPSISAMGIGFKAKDPLVSMENTALLGDGLMGNLTLSQPIFAGGKIFYGNKLSKLAIEVNKEQLKLSENEIILQVEDFYWELSSLSEKTNTLDLLDDFLSTLHSDVELSYKTGMITRNDLLEVRLKQNELKSSRINLENGIKLCKMNLCQLIGIDIDEVEAFDIQIPDMSNTESPISFYVNHKEAIVNRAENKLLDKNIEISKLQTKMKRGEYLPTVALGATYYQNNFMDTWDGNSAVFVTLSLPLTDWWKGTHSIKKQRIQERIAQNTKDDMHEQLLIQMQNVKNEMDNAYRQLLIKNESIEQAEENLRLNRDYYKVGTVKMSDLLNAQNLLQQSLDERTEAFCKYQRKCFEYLQVTGR